MALILPIQCRVDAGVRDLRGNRCGNIPPKSYGESATKKFSGIVRTKVDYRSSEYQPAGSKSSH